MLLNERLAANVVVAIILNSLSGAYWPIYERDKSRIHFLGPGIIVYRSSRPNDRVNGSIDIELKSDSANSESPLVI